MESFWVACVAAVVVVSYCGSNVHAQQRQGFKPVASAGHVEGVKPSLTEDASHMKEHLKDIVDVDTSKMTPAELEFHYFKMHDFDANNKLDGLEMLRALTHHIHETVSVLEMTESASHNAIDITPYENVIDEVLKDDDLDHDGYLSYEEYKHRMSKDSPETDRRKDM